MIDKHIYQQAFEELNAGNADAALWAMVWAKAGGDESKAKAAYVEARVREIEAQQRQSIRAAKGPLWKRRTWQLTAALCAGSLAFTALNQWISGRHYAGWGFYVIGTIASAAGLAAIPLFLALITWGRRWGFHVGFLVLLVTGCLAGAGDSPGAGAGYGAFGIFLFIFWLCFLPGVTD